jgi:hypothetical protein
VAKVGFEPRAGVFRSLRSRCVKEIEIEMCKAATGKVVVRFLHFNCEQHFFFQVMQGFDHRVSRERLGGYLQEKY